MSEFNGYARRLWRGALLNLPVAMGVGAYGVVCGVLSRQAGQTIGQLAGLSSGMFAGTAQFAAIGFWQTAGTAMALWLTVAAINLRYLLIGASTADYLRPLPWTLRVPAALLINDETWAVATAEHQAGRDAAGVILGGGLLVYFAWLVTTSIGWHVGNAQLDLKQWGLDFTLTAVLIALLSNLAVSRRQLPPWVIAGGVAAIAAWLVPSSWNAVLGGVAGIMVGMMRHD